MTITQTIASFESLDIQMGQLLKKPHSYFSKKATSSIAQEIIRQVQQYTQSGTFDLLSEDQTESIQKSIASIETQVEDIREKQGFVRKKYFGLGRLRSSNTEVQILNALREVKRLLRRTGSNRIEYQIRESFYEDGQYEEDLSSATSSPLELMKLETPGLAQRFAEKIRSDSAALFDPNPLQPKNSPEEWLAGWTYTNPRYLLEPQNTGSMETNLSEKHPLSLSLF